MTATLDRALPAADAGVMATATRTRRYLSGRGGARSPRSTSWRFWPRMTQPSRVRRARSCAGRACIPVTSWSGGGPATPGRWPRWPPRGAASGPILAMRRSRRCAGRRSGWSRSWPRPASWWMSRQNCKRSWSWDITKLHGPAKWTYYYLAVIPVALRQGRREDCGVGRHADDVPSGDERLELAAGEQLAGKVVQPHRHALGGQLGKRVMAGVTGYVQAFGCRCSPSRQVRAGRSAVPPVSGAKVAGWPPGREPCRASWMLSRAAAATASAVMPNWRYRVW